MLMRLLYQELWKEEGNIKELQGQVGKNKKIKKFPFRNEKINFSYCPCKITKMKEISYPSPHN